jgi:acetylornithine deacetylase/succinyl-diaminopimelate desuccinylase-like protein
MQKALDWVKENQDSIVENIKEFLRIPSISTDPAFKENILEAANWVKKNFERIGLESKLIETPGSPVVFAQTKVDPNKPTVLVYFHYDVQPAGDESLWKYPPFEPEVIEDRIYGRGTNDNKMAGLISTVALEAILKTGEELPVNFKFCIEGEEEISSPNVGKAVEENKELFDCDYVLLSDGTMLGEDSPSIELGYRGIVYLQFKVSIGSKDLHSGQAGGVVKNANNEIVKILASLKDKDGRITVPGIYDEVVLPSKEEIESWKQIDVSPEQRKNDNCVYELDEGEKGFSLLERNWSRPCLDINGVWGGYTGEGAKTVIPNEAFAKVSIRLVPDQDPEKIAKQLTDYLKSFENPGLKVEVQWVHSAPPFLTEANNPIFDKAKGAFKEVFGKEALFIRSGGTIGLLNDLDRILQKPILFIDVRSPDEDLHAPNEFLRLKNFWRGVEVCLRLFEKI